MFSIQKFANENAVYLIFGVILLGLLFYFVNQWKIKKMQEFAHIASAKKIFDNISVPRRFLKFSLLMLAYLFVSLAIMRPQGPPIDLPDDEDSNKKETSGELAKASKDAKGEQKVKVKEASRDIIFLLDVSGSMASEDLTPNRLEKAKDYINDIVDVLNGEHIGLVVFTSIPSVKCVLTLDYTYFKQVLKSVTINDNDYAGTKFYPALEEIINRQFDYSDNKSKELIIITDGGDTDLEGAKGEARKALEGQLLELVKKGYEENKIRVHTVGIGSLKGAVVPGVKDSSGSIVRSALDSDFLKLLSKEANGVYIGAEDGDPDMKEYYLKHIGVSDSQAKEKELTVDNKTLNDLVQKSKLEQDSKIVYSELFWLPALFAFLLLVTEFFVSERKKRVL